MHADDLAAAYPTARVDRNVLFVDDGNLITSAGTAAGIDEDATLEDRGGRLHAALELHRPQLGGLGAGVGHVEAVEHPVAVALDPHVVDHHR